MISLRTFGYKMRNPVAQRQKSLATAVVAHGWKEVIERLLWLQYAHGSNSKYINIIRADVQFILDTYAVKKKNGWFRTIAIAFTLAVVPLVIIAKRQ